MRTAYCFTPDRTFFAPAVRAIASMVEAEPDVEREIFLICEPDDVAPGFDTLHAPLRERITLMTLDFLRFDGKLAGKGRFSRAVFRRLFLDDILPALEAALRPQATRPQAPRRLGLNTYGALSP